MTKKVKKRKEIKRKLLHKYRLVILNESTFEEKISFKLSRLNVFVMGSLCIVGLIGLTILLIAFTPLREYIPGYSSTKLKKQATELTYKTDSLVLVLENTNRYLENIRLVLKGDIENNEINRDSLKKQFKLDASKIDFTPISGTVSQKYDAEKRHYAVDVVAPRDTPVKAVANGVVIFSEWTTETGYVIILEHKEGLLSVYKHNGSLNKTQGDIVRSGEVIASVGNTGELTTGPHLHFELWDNGTSINPLDFIDFK